MTTSLLTTLLTIQNIYLSFNEIYFLSQVFTSAANLVEEEAVNHPDPPSLGLLAWTANPDTHAT